MTRDKPVDSRRLYQQIADQIRGLIRGGQFPPRSRLPAERDLAQQLGISRPSLREALIALEIDGSVEIRMGSGVYVSVPPDRWADATRAMGESPSELMQARLAIEGTVILLACARVTADTLAVLSGTLDDMRSAFDDDRNPLEDDRRFHMAIAQQAGNSVLTRIIGELFDERHSQISTQISSKFETRDTWIAALGEHEAIHAALQAADPLRAQSAMRQHLLQSADRWMSSRRLR